MRQLNQFKDIRSYEPAQDPGASLASPALTRTHLESLMEQYAQRGGAIRAFKPGTSLVHAQKHTLVQYPWSKSYDNPFNASKRNK